MKNLEKNSKGDVLYAVFRSGIRVSDKVYNSDKDPSLLNELYYWENILYRYPDGTKMEILPIKK